MADMNSVPWVCKIVQGRAPSELSYGPLTRDQAENFVERWLAKHDPERKYFITAQTMPLLDPETMPKVYWE